MAFGKKRTGRGIVKSKSVDVLRRFLIKKLVTLIILLCVVPTFLSAEIIKVLRVYRNNEMLVQIDNVKKNIRLLGVRLLHQNVFDMYARLGNFKKEFRSSSLQIMNSIPSFIKKKIKKSDILEVDQFKGNDPLTGDLLYIIQLPNHTYLNLEIIRQGYAVPDLEVSNQKWREKFMSAYEEAIKKKKGLWRVWQWKKKFQTSLNQTKPPYSGQTNQTKPPYSGQTNQTKPPYSGQTNQTKPPYSGQTMQTKVSILTYNLENLFDTKIDSPRDTTYVPIQFKKNAAHIKKCKKMRFGKKACLSFDWSKEKLDKKTKRIAQVILSADARGQGPDILLLEELENYGVLKKLVTEHLADKGYKIYHVESRDFRGIDTAVISKLALAQIPRFHEIKFSRYRATRGILEVTFFLPNRELLTVFPLHFPSQFSKTHARAEALTFLDRYINTLPSVRYIIGGGDCNIVKEEEPELYNNYLKDWVISHRVGCTDCEGTYYYSPKKSWSFFDVFYYSKNLVAPVEQPEKKKTRSWVVDVNSIRIVNNLPFQNKKIPNTDKSIPMPFESVDELGVSDHWPVYMELNLQTPTPIISPLQKDQ